MRTPLPSGMYNRETYENGAQITVQWRIAIDQFGNRRTTKYDEFGLPLNWQSELYAISYEIKQLELSGALPSKIKPLRNRAIAMFDRIKAHATLRHWAKIFTIVVADLPAFDRFFAYLLDAAPQVAPNHHTYGYILHGLTREHTAIDNSTDKHPYANRVLNCIRIMEYRCVCSPVPLPLSCNCKTDIVVVMRW